jgi:hypothetical protein
MALFERVFPLMADAEQPVRHALLKLLKFVTAAVPTTQMVPYTPLLVAHTCRALTKLDAGVRHDALDFVDLWLACLPQHLMQHGDVLFANMLSLISSEKEGQDGARSLTVNPHSRLVQRQARIDVMRRFLSLVEVINSHSGTSALPQAQAPDMPHTSAPLVCYPSFGYVLVVPSLQHSLTLLAGHVWLALRHPCTPMWLHFCAR